MYRDRLMETFLPNPEAVEDGKWRPASQANEILLESVCKEGEKLYSKNKNISAIIYVDGSLKYDYYRGSIHKTGAYVQNKKTCNGWTFWYIERDNELISIDDLRNKYRKNIPKVVVIGKR